MAYINEFAISHSSQPHLQIPPWCLHSIFSHKWHMPYCVAKTLGLQPHMTWYISMSFPSPTHPNPTYKSNHGVFIAFLATSGTCHTVAKTLGLQPHMTWCMSMSSPSPSHPNPTSKSHHGVFISFLATCGTCHICG